MVKAIRSYPFEGKLPPKPVVALTGRSNVGKSSLLNKLVGQSIAAVSRQPGRTRKIWLYEAEKDFIWADLPGYGYAAVPESQRRSWLQQNIRFLEMVRPIVCVLVDSRLPPQQLDLTWVTRIERLALPYLILATKADTLSQAQRHHQRRILLEAFPRAVWKGFVSARSGEGIQEMKAWIYSFLPSYGKSLL